MAWAEPADGALVHLVKDTARLANVWCPMVLRTVTEEGVSHVTEAHIKDD